MNENYNVSSSPHIRDKVTSSNIMLMVVISLLPATFFGIWNFRHENAWILIVLTTAAAVLAEYLWEKLMHKPVTIKDFSAVVTGLLLALNLPPTLPWWMGVVGAFFAIIVVKQLFGGLGQNFMNPALGARCFLLICFAGKMTTFVYDGVTGNFCHRTDDRSNVPDPYGSDRSADSRNLHINICHFYFFIWRSWI